VVNIELRTGNPADEPAIAEFNVAMALETERIRLDPARVAAGVRAVLEDDSKGFYLVATDRGRIAGQLMITYEWSDWRNGNFWWIQSVYVHPDHRSQGIFRGLYDRILQLARAAEDVCGVRLYVERENHRARRTYESLGMKQTAYDLYEVDFVLAAKPTPDG
jgi:GNAT superfamily N-acetyltransferase